MKKARGKKVLITGVSGFAGSFLAEHLISQGRYRIYGTYLSELSLNNLVFVKNSLDAIHIDLTNRKGVSDLIAKIKPDCIYHLAAFTSPFVSFKNPFETLQNNIAIQINLLEALREHKMFYTRILIVSSAEIYGIVLRDDLPIDEETKLKPISPYAVSKIMQDFLGLQYFLAYRLPIVRVRPFNHIGPRQSQDFVASAFAKKIAEIEKGKRSPILKVGNLKAKRDFTDVRDIVVAYHLLMEKGKVGDVYNLGSGTSYRISDILKTLLSFSKKRIKVEVDPQLLKPNDIVELLCDNRKMKILTGWSPTIPIKVTLKDTLDYWRNII